jgi:hypothetical protein
MGVLVREAENRRLMSSSATPTRYKTSQELMKELNGTYRFEATLSCPLTLPLERKLVDYHTLSFKPDGEVL